MKEGYIAVLDSGIGGISVLKLLVNVMPYERYIYLGDNDNAPYGNLSNMQLSLLMSKNIDVLRNFPLKAIVLGCNTLSVRIREFICEYSGVKTFGVFPPVESVLNKDKKTLLLSTVKTAQIYNHIYKGIKNFTAIGLKNLASNIEKNCFNLNRVDLTENLSTENIVVYGDYVNSKSYYDNVILGCTHYFFIKNKIINHFCPQKIFSGEIFAVNALASFLKNQKSLANFRRNDIIFMGNNADKNKNIFEKGGQYC